MMNDSIDRDLYDFLDRCNSDPMSHDIGTYRAVAVLFLLKWIDFMEAEQEAVAVFEGRPYNPVLSPDLHWRTWKNFEEKILYGYLCDAVLPHLAGKNIQDNGNPVTAALRSPVAFFDILTRFKPSTIHTIVREMEKHSIETPSDRRATLEWYDEMLEAARRMQRGGHYAFEYQTPRGVTRLMARIAKPKANEKIYDPCFGFGGLLVAAVEACRPPLLLRESSPELSIAGIDINESVGLIGYVRLLLSGVTHPQVRICDSLQLDPPMDSDADGYDVILANPPFGMKLKPDQKNSWMPVDARDSDSAFIQHILLNLRPGGRAVVCVPEGFLFRGGAERRVRQMLLEENTVHAIVSLPPKAFSPATSIQTNLVFFERGGSTQSIRMAKAASFMESDGPRANLIPVDAISKVLSNSDQTDECWDADVSSLKDFDYDLSVKRRGKTSLDHTLKSLDKVGDVRQSALGELCEIRSGAHVSSKQQYGYAPDEGAVPFLRIKDIQDGKVLRLSKWLDTDHAASLPSASTLREGDILVSRSGTIGKIAVVDTAAEGAVPANGLFVLRIADPATVDMRYLAKYLQSVQCREWMDVHARGSAINTINKQILAMLPVPLVPISKQRQYAAMAEVDQCDILDIILAESTDAFIDPVVEWVRSVQLLQRLRNSGVDEWDMSSMVLDREVDAVKAKLATVFTDSDYEKWFNTIVRMIETTRGIGHLRGAGLLSVLMEMRQDGLKLEEISDGVKGLGSEDIRNISAALLRKIKASIDRLYKQVSLQFYVGKKALFADTFDELNIEVRNEGLLPLHSVVIGVSDYDGKWELNFLDAKESASKNFWLYLSDTIPRGYFDIKIKWQATMLNGETVSGGEVISVPVKERSAEDTAPQPVEELPGSPYICGDPVRPNKFDMFFGRDEQLDTIKRCIVENGNVVLLEGNRRSGKTSILNHLEGLGTISGWLTVYCSLQGATGSNTATGVPTEGVFRAMAIAIAKALQANSIQVPLPNGAKLEPGRTPGLARACREGISADSPFDDFCEYLEIVLQELSDINYGLVLMMDEFDKLQDGIDNGVTSPQVPENIRYLIQTYPRFSAILTGSRRLKKMREEYWSALFGLGTRVGVSALDPAAAEALVAKPVKDLLTYSKEAVLHAMELCASQPYILQCLCNRIYEEAAKLKTRSINVAIVDIAADKWVVDNEHFASLWSYAESDLKRYLLAVCHQNSDMGNHLTLRTISEILASNQIAVRDDDLAQDLESLVELEVLNKRKEPGGQTTYRLTIPLMGRWIDRQQDISALQVSALGAVGGGESDDGDAGSVKKLVKLADQAVLWKAKELIESARVCEAKGVLSGYDEFLSQINDLKQRVVDIESHAGLSERLDDEDVESLRRKLTLVIIKHGKEKENDG